MKMSTPGGARQRGIKGVCLADIPNTYSSSRCREHLPCAPLLTPRTWANPMWLPWFSGFHMEPVNTSPLSVPPLPPQASRAADILNSSQGPGGLRCVRSFFSWENLAQKEAVMCGDPTGLSTNVLLIPVYVSRGPLVLHNGVSRLPCLLL